MSQARRTRLLQSFESWLAETAETSLETAARDAPLFTDLTRTYGFERYDEEWPRNDFVDTLLAISDVVPWARPSLGGAWRVVRRWHQLEPSTPHVPLPLCLLRAMISVLASWHWTTVLASVWISFWSLLRPGELFGLRREDILLPHQHENQGIMIRLRAPKRRVGGARHEYARVDLEDVRGAVIYVLGRLGRGQHLWPASPASFANRFRRALGALVPHPSRYTAGSLRSGGATALFQRWSEDIGRLGWRGRWRDHRTLAHYIQELTALRITLDWAPQTRMLIEELAELCDEALDDLLLELSRGD